MNPDPRLRVQSADELLAELDALAVPRWTQAEAQAWWRDRGPAVKAARRTAANTGVPNAIMVDSARLDQVPAPRKAG